MTQGKVTELGDETEPQEMSDPDFKDFAQLTPLAWKPPAKPAPKSDSPGRTRPFHPQAARQAHTPARVYHTGRLRVYLMSSSENTIRS